MFSSIAGFFGPRRQFCDCCNHNADFDLLFELEDDEMVERQTLRNRFKNLIDSLRRRRIKGRYKKLRTAAREVTAKHFKSGLKRLRHRGKKRTFEVHRAEAPQAVDEEVDTDKQVDRSESAFSRLLTTVFTDIVSSDHIILQQTSPTTQCFLVHLFDDIDPEGPFLSRLTQPPSDAFDMDLNQVLGFVASWLQGSLTRIKSLYSEGGSDLQRPFCVLEMTADGAEERARALQRRYPDEKVGIATLDFEALLRDKLVASVSHTFGFLRVPRKGFRGGKRLLAWTGGGEDGPSAEGLRETVLTIYEWDETGMETDSGSVEEELRVAAQTPLPDDRDEEQWVKWRNAAGKKDSGTTSRTASGSSKDRITGSQGVLVDECPRSLSL